MEVILWGDIGRIWNVRPVCGADGLISVLQHPKHHLNAFSKCLFTNVAFSRHSEYFATVDNRGHVFIFYIKRNRFKCLARGGFAGTSIAFSQNNKNELYVGFADNSVQCYHPDTGQLLFTLKGHGSAVETMAFGPRSESLLTSSPDAIVLWDLLAVNRKKSLGAGPYGCAESHITPNGATLVSAFRDDTFWFWDAETFALQRKLRAPRAGRINLVVTSFAISPDGKNMVAVGRCPLLYVWDLVAHTLVCVIHLPPPTSAAFKVHFMPDSRVVAVGCDHGEVLFVDILDSTLSYGIPVPPPSRHPSGHVSPCCRFEVDSCGNYGLLVTRLGTARLYDLAVLRNHARGAERSLVRTQAADLPKMQGAAALAEGPGEPYALMDPAWAASSMAVPSSIARAAFGRGPRGRRGWTDTVAAGEARGKAGPKAPGARGSGPERRDPDPRRAAATSKLLDLDPESPEVSRERLRELLHAYGEYPAKYRLLVWRFLLGLPNNVEAHRALVGKGGHPAYDDLQQRYPIQSRTLFARLAKTLSALAHWSPVLGAAPYVPGLVFPFVKLMGADDVATFEAVATVLLNWCRGWFEMFPHPPLHVLGRVEALLAHHAPDLAHAIATRGGRTSVQLHIWALMQTLLTEVLSKEEWLKVWDHLLTNDPSFFAYIVVGYLVHFREPVSRAGDEGELRAFLRRANPLDVNALIRLAYRLRQDTATEMMDLGQPALERLPPGHAYPIFGGYPKVNLDWHVSERERLRAEEEMLLRRRHQVLEMASRTDALAQQEAAWRDEKERLAALEAGRRCQLAAEEDRLLHEQAVLDDLSKQETLRQVGVVEATYRGALQRQRAAWVAEMEQLRAETGAKQARLAQTVRSRLQEEQLRSLEFQSQQQLWAVEEEHLHASSVQRLRDELKSAAAADELELRRKQHEWAMEDDARAMARDHEAQRRARAVALEEEAAAREEVGRLLVEKTIEKEARVAEVERERRVRQAAEEEALRAAELLESERQRDKLHALEEERALKHAAEENRRTLNVKVEQRKAAVEDLEEARAVENAQRAAALKDLERAQRRREMDAQIEKERLEYEAINAAEERETRRVLMALEEERRRDRELEMQLRLKEEELRQKQQHGSRVDRVRAEADIDERDRFQELREELRKRWALEESEHRLKHEEVMARLALEREQQLVKLDTLWRRRTQLEETAELQEERKEYVVARDERERRFREEEMSLLREVHDLHGDHRVERTVQREERRVPGSPSTEGGETTTSASARGGGASTVHASAAAVAQARASAAEAERARADSSGSSFVPSDGPTTTTRAASGYEAASGGSRSTFTVNATTTTTTTTTAAAAARSRGGGVAAAGATPGGSDTGSSSDSPIEPAERAAMAAAAAAAASSPGAGTTPSSGEEFLSTSSRQQEAAETGSGSAYRRVSGGIGRREARAWAAAHQENLRTQSAASMRAGARGGGGGGPDSGASPYTSTWDSATTESGGDGGEFTSGSAASLEPSGASVGLDPHRGGAGASASAVRRATDSAIQNQFSGESLQIWESGLDITVEGGGAGLDITLTPGGGAARGGGPSASASSPGRPVGAGGGSSATPSSEFSAATLEAERIISRHRQRQARMASAAAAAATGLYSDDESDY